VGPTWQWHGERRGRANKWGPPVVIEREGQRGEEVGWGPAREGFVGRPERGMVGDSVILLPFCVCRTFWSSNSNLFKSNLFWNLFKPFDFSKLYTFTHSFFKQNLILYSISRVKIDLHLNRIFNKLIFHTIKLNAMPCSKHINLIMEFLQNHSWKCVFDIS
jgi:hypothetical protein